MTKQTIKSGKVEDAQKEFEQKKDATKLLSISLNELQDQFKLTDVNKMNMIQSADQVFEDYKKEYIESLEVVYPNVEPIGMEVITTASLMNILEKGDYLLNNEFSSERLTEFKEAVNDVQIVVAVGPDCRQLKIGDKVKIRFEDFQRIKNPNSVHSKEVSEIPLEIINKVRYLSCHERNIKYIYKE